MATSEHWLLSQPFGQVELVFFKCRFQITYESGPLMKEGTELVSVWTLKWQPMSGDKFLFEIGDTCSVYLEGPGERRDDQMKCKGIRFEVDRAGHVVRLANVADIVRRDHGSALGTVESFETVDTKGSAYRCLARPIETEAYACTDLIEKLFLDCSWLAGLTPEPVPPPGSLAVPPASALISPYASPVPSPVTPVYLPASDRLGLMTPRAPESRVALCGGCGVGSGDARSNGHFPVLAPRGRCGGCGAEVSGDVSPVTPTSAAAAAVAAEAADAGDPLMRRWRRFRDEPIPSSARDEVTRLVRDELEEYASSSSSLGAYVKPRIDGVSVHALSNSVTMERDGIPGACPARTYHDRLAFVGYEVGGEKFLSVFADFTECVVHSGPALSLVTLCTSPAIVAARAHFNAKAEAAFGKYTNVKRFDILKGSFGRRLRTEFKAVSTRGDANTEQLATALTKVGLDDAMRHAENIMRACCVELMTWDLLHTFLRQLNRASVASSTARALYRLFTSTETIKKGPLMKKVGVMRRWQQRCYKLHVGERTLHQWDDDLYEASSTKPKIYDLRQFSGCDKCESRVGGQEHAFVLVARDKRSKDFVLVAPDAETQEDWVTAFRRAFAQGCINTVLLLHSTIDQVGLKVASGDSPRRPALCEEEDLQAAVASMHQAISSLVNESPYMDVSGDVDYDPTEGLSHSNSEVDDRNKGLRTVSEGEMDAMVAAMDLFESFL